ncbi:hypothetical protein Cni_G10539 [Canna indica]|uniref:Uncharacterized protein n=1 Tax=Canna indica TaxID=4628 RepID=A0AAQ3K4H5_9LILI|nr:hypothetical protein Cni_G10539 [Canna indica]
MGTEVLRPQDCLLRSSPALRHPKPLRRRREGSPKQPAKPRLAMGQVTILRRGESLSEVKAKRGVQGPAEAPSAARAGWDSAVFGLDRLGPDPAMIPKEIRLRPQPTAAQMQDVYAGTAFESSPSPRALPLPSFSIKKEGSPPPAVVDCSATKDLRRLLRLE